MPVCNTTGKLTKSPMCDRKFPAESSKPGTRPERRTIILVDGIDQNGHFVAA